MSQSAQKRAARWSSRLAPGVMIAGMLSAVTLGGVSGCDTVALLSFSDRVFNDVTVVGLSPEGGSCRGTDGKAVMRFVLEDGDGNPIDDQTVIGNSEVALSRDDLAVRDVVVYELPDVNCSGASDCSNNFVCEATLLSGDTCQLTGQNVLVKEGARLISSSTAEVQALGVLVENTASISGQLPRAIAGQLPDYTGPDGVPDGKADRVGGDYNLVNAERATDRNNARLTGVSILETTWEQVHRKAVTDYQTRTAFGVWTFGGSRASVATTNPAGNEWVYTQAEAASTARALTEIGSEPAVASVYEAIEAVLDSEERFGVFADTDEKVLVVVVDGPDDLRLPAITAQTVIEKANARNVRLFIVHLDPAVKVRTESGTPLLPDLPSYVMSQDAECGSDADCKNFEECRPVTTYAGTDGSAVTSPSNQLTGNWCAVGRDENGRVGPIQDYAEIACATGGGYLYFPSRDKLSDNDGAMSKLPLALDGLWETSVDIDAFSRGTVEKNEPYKLGMLFSATVDGTTKSYNMTDDQIEVRPVIFSAE